jgi:hypothetical protein
VFFPLAIFWYPIGVSVLLVVWFCTFGLLKKIAFITLAKTRCVSYPFLLAHSKIGIVMFQQSPIPGEWI